MSKKLYFASDFHLGSPSREASLERELKIVSWLNYIEKDAGEIFLVGDLFDYWFEYKTVVPKGYVRLLGKLALLADAGIKLHIFTGNHDVWMYDYFPQEMNAEVHKQELSIERQGKKLFIAHGDGLGPGDYKYKLLKKVFTNNTCQWLYAKLHPGLGTKIATYFSRKSRQSNGEQDAKFYDEKENLLKFAENRQLISRHDYYVFGHRHLPLEWELKAGGKVFYLGDWMKHFTYAVLEEGQLYLKHYE